MNRTLLIGIILEIVGAVLIFKGILTNPVIWPLIVLGLITWVPAVFVMMSGIWRLWSTRKSNQRTGGHSLKSGLDFTRRVVYHDM